MFIDQTYTFSPFSGLTLSFQLFLYSVHVLIFYMYYTSPPPPPAGQLALAEGTYTAEYVPSARASIVSPNHAPTHVSLLLLLPQASWLWLKGHTRQSTWSSK